MKLSKSEMKTHSAQTVAPHRLSAHHIGLWWIIPIGHTTLFYMNIAYIVFYLQLTYPENQQVKLCKNYLLRDSCPVRHTNVVVVAVWVNESSTVQW